MKKYAEVIVYITAFEVIVVNFKSIEVVWDIYL